MTNIRFKYILLLFSLVFPTFFVAQTNIDSLIKVAENKATHDSVKIKLFGDISWELMASDIDKSLEYANKELELATKTNRKSDIAQAQSDIGNIYNRKSSYDTALFITIKPCLYEKN